MTDDERGPGRRIDRSLVVAAPLDVVWRAVSTADGLEAWLGGGVELDARPGRPVLVRWPDGSASRGLVERVEPERRIVFRWRRIAGVGLTLHASEPTRVTITLARLGPGETAVDVVESPAPLPAPPVAVDPAVPQGRGAA